MRFLFLFFPLLLFLPLASCGGTTSSKEEDYTEEYKAILGILDKVEYTIEDLREIQAYIGTFSAYKRDINQVAANIAEISVRDTNVRVGLLEYTPDTVAAFFEELFPDRNPFALPITFMQGNIWEEYSSQNS